MHMKIGLICMQQVGQGYILLLPVYILFHFFLKQAAFL